MFRKSNILKEHTAATEIIEKDLPVNPLSHLVITLDGYNVTDEATLAEVLAFINKIEVLHEGASIYSLESEDAAALQAYLLNSMPMLTQNIATDDAFRQLSLIVPFGRHLCNPLECFPPTKKGELTLKVNTTVPSASLDNSTIQIDACEMIGASPTHYLKNTVKAITAPGATGENAIDLPAGNDIVALLAWLTTFPATSSVTYGIKGFKIKIDNIEKRISYYTTKGLIGEMAQRISTLPRSIAAFGDVFPDNFVFIDFDPNKDSTELLHTEEGQDVELVADYGVDEASRLVISELVAVGG